MNFYWGKGNWAITTSDAFVPDNIGEGWLRVDSQKPMDGMEYIAVADSEREGWAVWAKDTTFEEEQKVVERLAVTIGIAQLIQSKIIRYNKENGVAFDNIDACTKYLYVPTYSHYQFCVDVISWTVSLWEAARKLEADIYAGIVEKPANVNDFLAQMPVFGE